MPRPLWSGSISFGLVTIPVSLMSAKEDPKVSFHLLDKKDFGRIGHKTINKKTGRQVSRDRIVKGYEYEPDQFVLLTPKDFERASPEKTKTIDIEDFVDLAEVDPLLFEQPYYLIPGKGGEKGYQLLKQAMKETGKVAIGTFVLREKQRLAAIFVRDDFLVLETMHYAHEVVTANEAARIHKRIEPVRITKRELEMAVALVNGMSSKWDPEKYRDTYYHDVMKMIRTKIKGGVSVESEFPKKTEAVPAKGKVLDLMPLLKKSLESAHHASRKRGRKGRTSGPKHVS